MKKYLRLLLTLFILVLPLNLKADHIYNVDMDIYIEDNGDAKITETWSVKADSGTEWYKQYLDLGIQEIYDFTVTMDGNDLTYKDWDVNESLSDKAGYYGINYIYNGIELCFGKSDMKRHQFTLKYTISNFVANTSDSQFIYQTLLPKATVDNFTVTISTFYSFNEDLNIWGFGYEGYAKIIDGKIKMYNKQNVSLDEDYVVLLAKFPLRTFDTQNTNGNYGEFDEIYELANNGAYYKTYEDDLPIFVKIILGFIITLFFILPIVIIVLISNKLNEKYGYINNKKISKKDTPINKDIPFNCDIYYANALIKLNNFGYNDSNIMGAIILKWLKEGKIKFDKQNDENKYTMVISSNPTFEYDDEKKLYNYLYKASKDGLLDEDKLNKWSKSHFNEFYYLFKEITNKKINELKNNGHIYKRKYKEECDEKFVMDDMIYNDSINLYGFKKYLDELINKTEIDKSISNNLWNDYLIIACLFGISGPLAKKFNDSYPKIIKEMEKHDFNYSKFYYFHHMTNTTAKTINTQYRNYSSSSSSSGGGGSFGGGGSMGGR